MDDKHWLSPQTPKRLSCDARLVTALEDEQNNRNQSLSAVPDVSAETCAGNGTIYHRISCGE